MQIIRFRAEQWNIYNLVLILKVNIERHLGSEENKLKIIYK